MCLLVDVGQGHHDVSVGGISPHYPGTAKRGIICNAFHEFLGHYQHQVRPRFHVVGRILVVRMIGVRITDARADVDMEDAVFNLFLKLSDDTHSVFDSKELVTVPDLSRFSSSRFGVSKTVKRDGRTRSGLYIAGEITRLRYIRSR